jgi:hypothetical protein
VNRLARILAASSLLVASVGAEQPYSCSQERSLDGKVGCTLLETAKFIDKLAALHDCRVDQAINEYQRRVTGKPYEAPNCKKL